MAASVQEVLIDTKYSWLQNNLVLTGNTVGVEIDTGYAKLGDGKTSWGNLAYLPAGWLATTEAAGGVTVMVAAPTGATATDTPAVVAAIASLTTALASGPATLLFQDGAYQIDSNSAVIRSPSATTVAAGSNGAEPSAWTTASPGTLDVASSSGFPSTGQVWVAASGSTIALVSYTGTGAGTLTGCVYLSGSPTGTLSTGGAVTGVLANFAVRSSGRTVIEQAPNRSGLPNNTTGDIFVIADCADFSVTGVTFDGQRDTVAPITALTAQANSGQASVTVASGHGSRYLAGQYLLLLGGLGTSEQNQYEGLGVGSGTPLVVQSITTGGGAGGGDLITFTANLGNTYTHVGGSLLSDGFGPYACTGAYLTPYQCGHDNSVAGRTLSGEDQQNGLHLLNCQRFTVTGAESRNVWESPVKLGSGFASTSLTDGCSQGIVSDCVAYHGYDQGISVWLSSQVTVSGNVINSAGWAGVSLSLSNLCTVSGNQILGSVYRVPEDLVDGNGVAIEGGQGNQVAGNIITGVYNSGVLLGLAPPVTALTASNAPTTSAYLTAGTAAGTSVQVSSTAALAAGDPCSILGGLQTEAVTVESVVDSTHVKFAQALRYPHPSGSYLVPQVPADNVISGNTINGTVAGHGIQAYLSVRSVIRGNVISGWAPGVTGAYGLIMSSLTSAASGGLPSGTYVGGDGTIAEANIFEGAGAGPAIISNYVSGLQLRGNTASGVFISAYSAPVMALYGLTDCVIDGNLIHDVAAEIGINLTTGGPATNVKSARVTVSGNVIERVSDLTGLFLQDADSLAITANVVRACSTGIEMQGVTNSAVTANICNSNQGTGILLDNDGSSVGSSGNRVTGNTCRDDGSGYDIDTGGTWTQQYGIRETGNSNYNLYTGNECDSNGTAQLVTAGAGSYAWANIISGAPAGPVPAALLPAGNLAQPLTSGGEAVLAQPLCNSNFTLISGQMEYTVWTAVATETINNVITTVQGTAASGLTFAGIAIYSVAANGNMTLLTSTGNVHSSLWTSAYDGYKTALTSAFSKVAGQTYAVAFLAVGTTPPSLASGGTSLFYFGDSTSLVTPQYGSLAGQSGFPSTVSAASVTGGTPIAAAVKP
jgi:parallel beta-helix repeat protein